MGRFLIHNARIVDSKIDIPFGWIIVDNGCVMELGEGEKPEGRFSDVLDADGKILMPGAIDEHVHFREPGFTDKADMTSESMAAAAGGITSFFDMPNTDPPTTNEETWQDKMSVAAKKSLVNYAFFIGAKPDNLDFIEHADYSRIPGIKLFMGSTTGSEASDSDAFMRRLFSIAGSIIAVHAEDEDVIARCRKEIIRVNGNNPSISAHKDIRPAEACVSATKRITGLAREYGKRIHIMHVSTVAELSFFVKGDVTGKMITCETCPQYLFFEDSDYERLGSRIKCNPSIKNHDDRIALTEAVRSGLIDCIATDHAPHLPEDKVGSALTAASGMPGVQFSVPLMMEFARNNGMRPSDVSRLMSANPAAIWGVSERGMLREGYHADLILVGESEETEITDDSVISRCGWTPYIGLKTRYFIDSTWVNGKKVYDKASGFADSERAAMAIRFRKRN